MQSNFVCKLIIVNIMHHKKHVRKTKNFHQVDCNKFIKEQCFANVESPIIVFDDLSDCMLCARQACFALIQCSFLVFYSQFSLLVLKTCVFVRIKLLVELSSTLGVWWTTNIYSINTNAKAIRKELILK